MKLKPILLAALCLTAFIAGADATQRASTDYSVDLDTVDAGGTTFTSTDYSINASVNDYGATAGEQFPGYLAKGGYIGQLFDVASLLPTAPGTTLNEGVTLQLGVVQVLDDETLLPVDPSAVTWSVASGPITGINTNGLATGATVYQDTLAVARADYLGYSGTLSLTILNVNTDDFGSYAGDGLPDDWQVQYFGENNANAAPGVDADGTGQTNLFKYIAGLNPLDPTARFVVSIQPVVGQPAQKQIVFTPVVAGRTYRVVSKGSLTDPDWSTLTSSAQDDSGAQRTVTDLEASGPMKFYRVQISKP